MGTVEPSISTATTKDILPRMMLTIILFLCSVSVTTISSVPIEQTRETTCDKIQMGANLLLAAEEATGCCQEDDCERVENEDCRVFAQEKLQPCLLNNDESCTIEAVRHSIATLCLPAQTSETLAKLLSTFAHL